MLKSLLLLLLSMLVLAGCGNKSTIKNDVKPKSLAESYGDGKFLYPEPFLPITDIEQYNSQVPNAGPLLSGMARFFMGVGVGLGAGKVNMSLVQPLPKIPREYVKDIRLKRVFFFIEPKDGERRKCRNFFTCAIFGKGDVDFDFIGKIAILIRPHHLTKRNSWLPKMNTEEKLTKNLRQRFENIFSKRAPAFPEVVDPRSARDILIMKYDKTRVDKQGVNEYIKNDEYGAMFIFKTQKRKNIIKLRDFLKNDDVLNDQINNMFILEDSLMVELKKDPIIRETFLAVYNREKDRLESLEVNFEECSPQTCLDLRLPDISLIDIVTRDNAVKLDAFMEAADVPETFRLKGFIEFKTQIFSPI